MESSGDAGDFLPAGIQRTVENVNGECKIEMSVYKNIGNSDGRVPM